VFATNKRKAGPNSPAGLFVFRQSVAYAQAPAWDGFLDLDRDRGAGGDGGSVGALARPLKVIA
jgi:hypothetical protein